jgi:hypothetical protein
MARNLGQDKAKAEGDAHECVPAGQSGDAENKMDLSNNAIGRMDAEREGDCYKLCKDDPRLIKDVKEVPPNPGPLPHGP